LHRQGLQRMLDLGGSTLRESVLHDPLVGALLALHDLHPLSVEQRALAALERSRAELGASSVQVELISAREGVVRVRISGKHADEARESLFDSLWAAAPDATGIEIETVGPVIQLGIGQLGISA
ncbi:MAG TPA: hypothetical protein VH083_27995, partial [Myxococcales bacterium]|nr:hypothetical protein [Myxococcales bacterium]